MPQFRLRTDQVAIGTPLPFDAYDGRGILLLRRGSIIANTGQLERLINTGLYRDDPAAKCQGVLVSGYLPERAHGLHVVSVIHSLDAARSKAEAMLRNTDPAGFTAQVQELAHDIKSAAALDPDAAIGNVVVSRGTWYPARHAVNCAAIGSLLLTRQGVPLEQIDDCLCALLTMNISTLDLQDELYRQQAPLSDEQKRVMQEHPEKSVAILRERGVVSQPWLDAVLQHHEALNGGGYPGKLGADKIGRFARVLALVDQYCALVSERAFREGANPSVAAMHLSANQARALDADLCALLKRELTPYPPGSAVRLANGEIAIVCRRTRHADQPIVSALLAADGHHFPEPRKRVTSQAAYHIAKPVGQGELKTVLVADKLWGDSFTAA